MRFPMNKKSKPQEPPIGEPFIEEYDALDAVLDTRAAAEETQANSSPDEPDASSSDIFLPESAAEKAAGSDPTVPADAYAAAREIKAAGSDATAPAEPTAAAVETKPAENAAEPVAAEAKPEEAAPDPAGTKADVAGQEDTQDTPVQEDSSGETQAEKEPSAFDGVKDAKEAEKDAQDIAKDVQDAAKDAESAAPKAKKGKKKKHHTSEKIEKAKKLFEEFKELAEEEKDEQDEDDEPDEEPEIPEEKPGRKGKKKHKRKKPKRHKGKDRFITPLIFLAILIGMVCAAIWNINYCKNNFEVNFYQIDSMRVSSGVRIVVISDVHLSEYGKDNCDLVGAVRALEPDIIVSAGDLVTYGNPDYENMLSLCRQLVEIAPTYGVMGNHEDEKTYVEMDGELRTRFAETGMKLLINSKETIKIRNNEIELIGVNGGCEEFDLYGGKKLMEKLPENHTALRVCVAHVPTLFRDRLADYDFDIGIAGHTHGGLIRLPMIGGLYSAEEGFRPEFDGGLYDLKNGATLFVSRGLGNSGKIPRFNNTPELAVIDVRWY